MQKQIMGATSNSCPQMSEHRGEFISILGELNRCDQLSSEYSVCRRITQVQVCDLVGLCFALIGHYQIHKDEHVDRKEQSEENMTKVAHRELYQNLHITHRRELSQK